MKIKAGFLTENKVDVASKLILFILSPFLGFIYSLKRVNTKSSFIIFFLFSLCFGMCFMPMKNPEYIDGMFYQNYFIERSNEIAENPEMEFKDFLESSVIADKDYYLDTMVFIVSKFSNNYHVFFMCIAAIFSFFSLKTFRYIVNEKEFDNSYMCLLLSYLFMYITIFNINGCRFWTGYWIAMFALFKIFRENKYKYLLLLGVAALCHASLWLLIPIVLLTIITKKFNRIWTILYFVSFFSGQAIILLIDNVKEYLPEFLLYFTENYVLEDYTKPIGTGFWIIGEVFRYIVDIFLFIVMILFINNKQRIIADERTKNIFALLLSIMTFSNFAATIPSLGVRFMIFSYPLIAYIWLLCMKNYKKEYSAFFMLVPIYFFMRIYSTITYYINTLSIDFFIASPIYLITKYLF